MISYHVRPDCNQLLINCQSCGEIDVLEVPYPVVDCPCPNCDAPVLIEAVIITTRTMSIRKVHDKIQDWLSWHSMFNLSQVLWSSMLLMPYKRREP